MKCQECDNKATHTSPRPYCTRHWYTCFWLKGYSRQELEAVIAINADADEVLAAEELLGEIGGQTHE